MWLPNCSHRFWFGPIGPKVIGNWRWVQVLLRYSWQDATEFVFKQASVSLENLFLKCFQAFLEHMASVNPETGHSAQLRELCTKEVEGIAGKMLDIVKSVVSAEELNEKKKFFGSVRQAFAILDATHVHVALGGSFDTSPESVIFALCKFLDNPPAEACAADNFKDFKEKVTAKILLMVEHELSEALKSCFQRQPGRNLIEFMLAKAPTLNLDNLAPTDVLSAEISKAKKVCDGLMVGMPEWGQKRMGAALLAFCAGDTVLTDADSVGPTDVEAPLWMWCTFPRCFHLTSSIKFLSHAFDALLQDAAPVYDQFVSKLLKMILFRVWSCVSCC